MLQVDAKSAKAVRFVTFNVNGVRTLFHYHPWNSVRNLSGVFSAFGADFITLQELKLSPKDVDHQQGRVSGFQTFITLPQTKKGYSGVGVYVRVPAESEPESVRNALNVVNVEEGLTGELLSQPDRLRKYRECGAQGIGGYPDLYDEQTRKDIDSEGRCVIVELAVNLVVISVYCPANSMRSDQGELFRIRFLKLLFQRIRNLHGLGKQVVLLGDINISRDLIDSADGIDDRRKQKLLKEPTDESEFESANTDQCLEFITNSIPRIIFNELLFDSLLSPADPLFFDTVRKHVGRKMKLYTCWNTLANCRPGNFGSRIDYILSTKELGQRLVNSNILPLVMGSDHCPVFADFDVDGLKCTQLNTKTCKFEAKFVYKLSNGSTIDLLFKKRPAPGTSNGTTNNFPAASTTKSSAIAETPQNKKIKLETKKSIKSKNDISSFFKPPKQPNEEEPEEFITAPAVQAAPAADPNKFDPSKPKLKLGNNGLFNFPPTVEVPNCKCDQPCILKTARTAENKGKKFWTCSKSPGDANCGFFKWK